MMLRRRMMGGTKGGGGEPLGEFSAGYAATLTPGSTTEWVVRHNLNIIPKIVIVEMVGEPTLTNYGIEAIYEMDVLNLEDNKIGAMAYSYYYSNKLQANSRLLQETSYIEVTNKTVTLKPVYSAARSPWDTGTTYHVQVYG